MRDEHWFIMNFPLPPIIFYWRRFKLKVILAYTFYISYFRTKKIQNNPFSYKLVLKAIKRYKHRMKSCDWDKMKYLIGKKCVVIQLHERKTSSPSVLFSRIITDSWILEKMGVEVKYSSNKSIGSVFYIQGDLDDMRQYKPNCPRFSMNRACFYRQIAMCFITPEVGHNIMSKLCFKPEIEEQVDECVNPYAEEGWIAVHYRGTDSIQCNSRYFALESYIVYLKKVLDNRHRIFACSDQAQFIDAMHTAFPGRVFSTDARRSYDEFPIHISREGRHAKPHQKREALIDLLILAKAKLIYTTGSDFVDSVRWLNPHTKIISLDGRKRKGNYLAIPAKDIIMPHFKMEKIN